MKYYGVDYYPEQWGLDHLENDLNDIVELGANLIRIGDFAWCVFEPKEGDFHFELFDEVIAKAKEKGLKVMLGIPSATMPAWLYKKDPSIMNVNEHGYKQPYGARRGYCVNSDLYFEKVRILTRKIAEHYKDEDTVVSIQIDNEIGHEGSDACYCDNCRDKFRKYLKDKYLNIEELNNRMGTIFWSQHYNDFDEINVPKATLQPQNPSLRLEYHRFRALSQERYLKMMADTVREVCDKKVTHDFSGGTYNKLLNPFEISKHLDFVSYNNYPVWGGQSSALSDSDLAFILDFVRGFKQEKFTITEAIMGAQGHNDIGMAPRPLQAKKWASDALKHGVESTIFFRYRGFTKGAEQYCFGIVDSDNQKRRRYYETQSFFKENKDLEVEYPKADACLIFDYDSKESMNIQRQSDTFSWEAECMKIYNQFFERNLNLDIIPSTKDFSNYKYVILPYMIIMSDEFKLKLKDYVNNGGIVVCTPRTAWKDLDNNLVFGKRIPVDLSDLVGGELEEHESLLTGITMPLNMNGEMGEATVFAEMFTLNSAKPLIQYVNNPFGEYAAAFVNEYGLGKCYTLATSISKNLLTKLFDEILSN